MKFIEDVHKTYEKDIIKHLRAYNRQQVGDYQLESIYIYIKKDQQLLGGLSAHLFWDWISIGNLYYQNQFILKMMVDTLWQKYHHKAQGIRLFTPVKSRYEDALAAGFKANGMVKKLGDWNYYYANYMSQNKLDQHAFDITVSNEPQKVYQSIVDHHEETFKKRHGIVSDHEDYLYVALDKDVFVGGVQCEIYDDSVYISRIVVVDDYKQQNIGRQLMEAVEEETLRLGHDHIQLGTCDFQARGFYEKLGYQVVHTQENHPKGHRSFTMIKHLK